MKETFSFKYAAIGIKIFAKIYAALFLLIICMIVLIEVIQKGNVEKATINSIIALIGANTFLGIFLALGYYGSIKNSITVTDEGVEVNSIRKNFFIPWDQILTVERGMFNYNIVVKTTRGKFYIGTQIMKEPHEFSVFGRIKRSFESLQELINIFKEKAPNAKFILIDEMMRDIKRDLGIKDE